MHRSLLIAIGLGLLATTAWAAPETQYEARWVRVELARELPDDLIHPEGKTRWELTALEAGGKSVRTIDGSGSAMRMRDRGTEEFSWSVIDAHYVDLEGQDGVERWLRPERDPALFETSHRQPLRLSERLQDASAELRIEIRRVGLGWVFLPSGPREAVLQRALVLRKPEGAAGYRPHLLYHRWVDPRAGVVAEVWGPVGSDGTGRVAIAGAAYIESVTRGATDLKIFADQIDRPVYTRLAYGFDRGANIAVSALTPDAYATIGDLVGASSWDFSGNTQANAVAEIASTAVPINADETCSFDKCGFTVANGKLDRQDRNFELSNPGPDELGITLTVEEREDRANDVTLWLRAAVENEGVPFLQLGQSESRLCHVGVDEFQGVQRVPIPLWRFAHQDGAGQPFYMQLGDAWSSTPAFNCEQSIFVHTCPGNCGGIIFDFCHVWIAQCAGPPPPALAGVESATIINEGPVTLPSGHTFQSLVVRNNVEFCVWLGDENCTPGSEQDRVRTVIYQWMAPYLGTIVRLTSATFEDSDTAFTTLSETDIKFGLFPPRSVSVAAIGETSADLSWDPGLDTHRIDDYKIYWGQTSGSYSDSITRSATDGTTATITGLSPGTEYFFTVTTLSDYTDPSPTGPDPPITTQYESVRFPLTVPADPGPLPVEVSATTTGGACVPTAPVTGLTVNKTAGPEIELCWDPATDPCLEGYQILGADSPESDVNFIALVDDTGLSTCQSLDTGRGYLLVVTKGSGGTGPWGHFGR